MDLSLVTRRCTFIGRLCMSGRNTLCVKALRYSGCYRSRAQHTLTSIQKSIVVLAI